MTKTKERVSGGELVAAFLLFPIPLFYRPYVFAYGWGQFVAPLGVPVIGYGHAFALMLVHHLVAYQFPQRNDSSDRNPLVTIIGVTTGCAALHLVLWLLS